MSTNWDDFDAGSLHALAQVFDRGGGGGDDVGFHFQAVAVHADGRADAILPIHDEAALDDVDDFAVVGDGDGLGGIQGAGHIILVDHAAGNAHHAAAVDRGNVRAGQADQGRGDFQTEERSAFSIERAMDWEAAARSTMVPLRMPWEGSMPTPRMRRLCSPSTRATRVQTLVVPISIPTTIGSSIGLLHPVEWRIGLLHANHSGGNPPFDERLVDGVIYNQF